MPLTSVKEFRAKNLSLDGDYAIRRRFKHKDRSCTMNELVFHFYQAAKNADAKDVRKALRDLKKLNSRANAKIDSLSPFQKLLYRICKAVGNFFFRLKYGRSREEFIQEIRNKFPRPIKPSSSKANSEPRKPSIDPGSKENKRFVEIPKFLSLASEVGSPLVVQDVEQGLLQGVIGQLDKYEVNQPLVLKQGSAKVKVQMTGSIFKAKMESGFAYMLAVDLMQGGQKQHFKLAFKSFEDVSDVIAIGNLALKQMGKAQQFISSSSVQPKMLLNSAHNIYTPLRPSLEFNTQVSEKDQQDEIAELDATFRRGAEEQKILANALEDEASFMEGDDQDLSASVINRNSEREALGLDRKHCDVVGYIYHYLNELKAEVENPAKSIQDTDNIAFIGGEIRKAASDAEAKSSNKVFFHILRETFGTHLARRVFGRYGLNKKDTVSLRDLKKAMVGVAMNVMERDLRELFQHIRQDKKPGNLTSYLAGNSLYQMNKELYLEIKKKKSFDELSTVELNFLHSAFRTVPIQDKRLRVTDVLNHLKQRDDGKDFLYSHDLDALALMESWPELDLTHPDLAIGQHAGKSLAYLELKPGLILPMPQVSKDGSIALAPQLYVVAKSLPHKNDAVVLHILAPLNANQAIFPQDPNLKSEDAFIVCRGTLPNPGAVAGGMSLYRDFHYKGIGRATYDLREVEIIQMIEEYLKNRGENVTLHLSGHSLGGCDTQRLLTTILEQIAKSAEGSVWSKVTHIDATTFNAPKVNQSVNARGKAAVKTINQKGSSLKLDIKHIRFYDKTYEDTIQKFGDILWGADYHGGTGNEVFKNAPNVKRAIFKLHMDDDQGLVTGFLTRHSYRPFNKALCNVPYRMEVLSSENESDIVQMEKEMAGTYYWNDTEMGTFTKILGNVLWYTTSFGFREPKKAIQAVIVNVPHSLGLTINRSLYSHSNKELDQRREDS